MPMKDKGHRVSKPMPSLTLISFDLCPFVQRSAILLRHKGLDFIRQDIDLASKPEWFTAISPRGKVPVLTFSEREEVLFESLVILEYLDEAYGQPLHSSDLIEKARDRALMSFSDDFIMSSYRLGIAEHEEDAKREAKRLNGLFAHVEDSIHGNFFKDHFSMIDIACAPGLQRAYWSHGISPDLGIFENRPKTLAWAQSLEEHLAVVQSIDSGLRDRYTRYLQGDRTPTHQTESSWLGLQAG